MQVNLKGNKLGEEGWCAVFDALRDNPQNKIAKWDLFDQGINPTIAKSLAAHMTVASSLTELNARLNDLGSEGKSALQDAVRSKKGFNLLI